MNQKFRLPKKQEGGIIITLLGVLVAYGFYQVAYGMTMGPNGTVNVPGMPNGTWATITASPGTKVSNITNNERKHIGKVNSTTARKSAKPVPSLAHGRFRSDHG
ncbi:MAG: hypothetical protein WA364_10785 [Candidatus Nitrosopolaris sp.]